MQLLERNQRHREAFIALLTLHPSLLLDSAGTVALGRGGATGGWFRGGEGVFWGGGEKNGVDQAPKGVRSAEASFAISSWAW